MKTQTFMDIHILSAARIVDWFGHKMHQKKRNWMGYEFDGGFIKEYIV